MVIDTGKLLNMVISGNANQNTVELSCTPVRMALITKEQQTTVLSEDEKENGTLIALLVGIAQNKLVCSNWKT